MNQDENQQGAKKVMPIPLMFLLVTGACLLLVFNTTHVQYSRKSYIPPETVPETVEVAMARVSLPAITVITHKHINTEIVSRDELPRGQLVGPSQVLGRVLAMPVVEGQVLTESCFVPAGTAALLAVAIPHGMRAVTVSVSDKGMPDSALLYPGCVVDVLAEYNSSSSEDEALSTTILRGIHVLAISGNGTSRGNMLTLLLTIRQAEALSLAIEKGSISLAVRNPLDRKLNPLPDFRIGPSGEDISRIDQSDVVQVNERPRWEVTLIRGRTIQRICSEPDSSRRQPGLSSLSITDENGDEWVLGLARGQSISGLKNSNAKPGRPLLVKTDVQIKGRNVYIGLIVEGQAGEKYVGGVRKNSQRQPAPVFTIVDEAGTVLASGRFKYG
jgi:Flp pilus assembly protein CpaB